MEIISEPLKISKIDDEKLVEEMEIAIKPEYLVLFPDTLNINFPQGTLPSAEFSYEIELPYKNLEGLIHDWAIPSAL